MARLKRFKNGNDLKNTIISFDWEEQFRSFKSLLALVKKKLVKF